MIGRLLAVLFTVVASAWLLYVALRPARAIWRGDADRLPHLPGLEINAHSYLAFLLWFVPCWTGLGLAGLGVAAYEAGLPAGRPAGVTGGVIFLSGLLLVPVRWFVSTFARPRFLVPPPYRDHPGRLAAARERRRRTRAGLPPTDHVVEILDVRPLPSEPGAFAPYLMAQCTEAGCDWREFPDDKVLGISEEQQLRDGAAKHTTRVRAGLQRPLG